MDEQTLTPFVFEGETIRVIRRNLVFWFVAADICRALGISNPSQAVKARRESERSTICLNEGGPDRLSISESGLYALILRSDGALTKGTTAYRFRDWVTMEVLPSVRAQGSYTHTSPVSGPPEALKVRIITEARKTFGTRSSGEFMVLLRHAHHAFNATFAGSSRSVS